MWEVCRPLKELHHPTMCCLFFSFYHCNSFSLVDVAPIISQGKKSAIVNYRQIPSLISTFLSDREGAREKNISYKYNHTT